MTTLTKSESLTLDLMISTMQDELKNAKKRPENSIGDIKEAQAMLDVVRKLRKGVETEQERP